MNMGSKHITFIQLNCHNAMVSENQLAQDIIAEGVDVISLNEPYVCEGSVLGTPDGWTQLSSAGNRFRATLCVSRHHL